MKATLLPGFKYSNGEHICVNCAYDEKNKEHMKNLERNYEPIFRGELSETKSPKCVICKTKLTDVVRNFSKSGEDEDEPKREIKKASSIAPVTLKKRGRPAKIKMEVAVTPKKRGRPKGSKNKPK